MSAHPRRILLVDDTETVLIYTRLMLLDEGAEIVFARDGLEALTSAAERLPDLVLLDIQMPRLDGVETCRRLKHDPRTASVPVVMLTTKGNRERVEAAFDAGCDDFLTKPYARLDLLAKVRRYIN